MRVFMKINALNLLFCECFLFKLGVISSQTAFIFSTYINIIIIIFAFICAVVSAKWRGHGCIFSLIYFSLSHSVLQHHILNLNLNNLLHRLDEPLGIVCVINVF